MTVKALTDLQGLKDKNVEELKAIGIDQFLEICQTAYDRQYK